MRRREFLNVLGGVAAAWPVVGRAQQSDRPRRIGVMVNGAASDPEMQARVLAFKRGLEQLGWSEGRNINIDTRFADKPNLYAPLAKELIALGDRMSYLLMRRPLLRPCSGKAARSQSFLFPYPIRSAQALSRAWDGRAATSPD